jgi:tetratricopeptide (TPR) repeat protein
MSRAAILGQLGLVAYERFREARAAKKLRPELLRHLNDALRRYIEELELTPPDAVGQLAVTHHQLGNIYGDAGDLDRALHYWRESIRLEEASSDLYGTATTRHNVAIALKNAGRLADARQYAEAALRDYQTSGPVPRTTSRRRSP